MRDASEMEGTEYDYETGAGRDHVISDVIAERVRQDEEFGGPSHDDSHSVDEWLTYIQKQMWRCAVPALDERLDQDERAEKVRERYIKIAALAVAATESLDRTMERYHQLVESADPDRESI